ncbi:MAG: hypothetical protein ABI183_10270 [Polyangiaceae bacterium]
MMAALDKPVVVSMGAVTPLAEGAVEGAMLLRVGMTAISDTPRNDADGAPIMMGFLPTIAADIEGDDRVAVLARRALVECRDRLERLTAHSSEGARKKRRMRVGIASLTSPNRRTPHVSAPIDLTIAAELRGFEPGPRWFGDWAELGTRDSLAEAVRWLRSGEADLVFWGGAHSDWSTERLRALDDRGDLYRLESLDAVIPGEGAAFLALTSESFATSIGASPMARIEGSASIAARGHVSGSHVSGSHVSGSHVSGSHVSGSHVAGSSDASPDLGGFAEVLRKAVGSEPVILGWVLSDLTFEAARLAEWEAMLIRAHDLLGRPYLIDNPCRRIGALGAAAIPMFAAFFVASWASRMPASRSAAALDSTESGTRSAVWLTSLCPSPPSPPAGG